MKIFNNFIIVLILIATVSCKKKEYPESTKEGSPVFNCAMTVDGTPIALSAGVDNYYMYSSYQQDSNNVYGFTAKLKQTDCNNCPNSLEIRINDFKVSASNGPAQIDSALLPGNYNYLQSTAASFYEAQFQSSYNKTAASYFWNFGDGTTSTLANPTHVYKRSGNYKVNLNINGTSSCVSSASNFENIGIFNYKFRTLINEDSSMGNLINFSSINSQGVGPYQYLWNFGDGSTSTLASPSHNYQHTGSYPVTLRVTDIYNGDIAYAKYNVVTQSDLSSCAANYTLNAVNYSPNTLGLSNIVVNWTDANGVVYSSKSPLQPLSSYFTIVSTESFQNNDNNQMTKKLHVKFTCTLYNGASSILLSNADAIICVAYK